MPQSHHVRFAGHNNVQLDGRLELPEAPRCFATFSHCFTCTKDTLAAYRISKELAKLDIATLRFDFAGLGKSAGNFADTNFSTNKNDLQAAIHFLAKEYDSPQLLIGHSLGGTAALACAADNDAIAGVVTIASPSQPAHVLHHFGSALDQLEAGNPAAITVAATDYPIKPQFVDDIRSHDMQRLLSKLDTPVLIFEVIDDEIVGAHNARDIEQWSRGESDTRLLNNTDHIISDKQTAIDIANQISDFYNHHR